MLYMQGGSRLGAGRKPKVDKKVMKNIYLTPEQVDKINSLELYGYKNFSQKCSTLMDVAFGNLSKNKNSKSKLKFIDLFAGIGGFERDLRIQIQSVFFLLNGTNMLRKRTKLIMGKGLMEI